MKRRTLLSLIGIAGSVGVLGLPGRSAGETQAGLSDTGVPGLDDAEYRLIAAMSEGIIPATDTPGAIGAGVPDFFRTIFSDWLLKDEQIAFRASLQNYDAQASQRFGKKFVDCAAAQQNELLLDWDGKAMNMSARPPHPFAQFKRLTLHGYYTSQVGMEQELQLQMGAGIDHPNGPVMDVGGFLT